MCTDILPSLCGLGSILVSKTVKGIFPLDGNKDLIPGEKN